MLAIVLRICSTRGSAVYERSAPASDSLAFLQKQKTGDKCYVAGVSHGSQGRFRSRGPDELIQEAEFVVEPVTERQARPAYADVGIGSGHPAGLNFGDCLSYALALDLREPLLWKGNDFGHTGVQSALEKR
jgi:uncharacterized protein with PIN domain